MIADASATKNRKEVVTSVNLGLGSVEASLRARIKFYKKRAQEIERYLSKKPEEWGRFQSEFNSEVNGFFREIMNFERTCSGSGTMEKVLKLKKLFTNRIRDLFQRGAYNVWSLKKPYGYAGDFKIIDDIYQNNPTTIGFDRLFDNYFQMSAISVAVRNRKEDIKKLLLDFINGKEGQPIRVMNLACGSSRDITELFQSGALDGRNIMFDCFDAEEKALEYAKTLLADNPYVKFGKINALRLAAAKNINSIIDVKYDFIYSLGLFDYFNHKISVRLIKNLKSRLKKGGLLFIANVRDKYSNPSVHYMEWAGD